MQGQRKYPQRLKDQSLIAQTNHEMWDTRDPHGMLQVRAKTAGRVKPTIRGHEPDFGKFDGKVDTRAEGDYGITTMDSSNMHSKLWYQHIPTVDPAATHEGMVRKDLTIYPAKEEAPRRRRTLPRVPTLREDAAVCRERRLKDYVPSGTIGLLPGSTVPGHQNLGDANPTDYTTTTEEAHPSQEELLRREEVFVENFGHGVTGKTLQPCSQLGPPRWPKVPKWALKTYTNEERPPWNPTAGGANVTFGADVEPVLGKQDRFRQQKQLWVDRHLIQSLRVPDDPNSDWRMEKARRLVQEDIAFGRDDDDLPDVFVRMLDPKHFHGTHKHRFDENGKGLGIEGRRDDNEFELTVAGAATITRTPNLAMDAPHKPVLPWEERKMRGYDAYHTRTIDPTWSTDDAFTDEVMTDPNSIYKRLAEEQMATKVRDGGDYEAGQKARRAYNLDPFLVKAWQTSDVADI